MFDVRFSLAQCDAKAGMLVLISPFSITTWPVYTVPTLAFKLIRFLFFQFSKLFLANRTVSPNPLPLSLRRCWAEVSLQCGAEKQERQRSCRSTDLRALGEGKHDPNTSASSELASVLRRVGLELQLSSAVTALWSPSQTGFTVREEEVDWGAFDYWCTVPNICEGCNWSQL